MKNRKRFVSILAGIMAAIMILTLVLSLLPTRANAASSSEIRKQINQLRQDKKDIQAQIDDLKSQYQENENEIAGIVEKKNLLDQEINLLHAQLTNITEQISAYNALVADKQDELDNAQDRFDGLSESYKGRIRTMEEEGTLSYWEVLFHANSFSDLLDRLNMVEEIAASDVRHLEELDQAAKAVDQSRIELAEEKKGLEATKEELDATQAEVDKKRAEADDLIVQLLAKGDELEGLWEEKEQMDKELLAEIARMEKEYNEAKEREWLAHLATATTAPPPSTGSNNGGGNNGGGSADPDDGIDLSGNNGGGTSNNGGDNNNGGGNDGSSGGNNGGSSGGGWMVPVSYVKLTSPFGFREQPTAGASTYHQGVDLAAPKGTPIVASRGGTVTTAGSSGSLGLYVIVNHGDGFSSLYAHMEFISVSSGQAVSAGQQLGGVGRSGITTGYHLHFGIMNNGAYVNPAAYVPLY